ncbi:MAG TPA: hypothetical protein VFC19_29840 [Candidatus Limnocylindrales bacterium]|nr:hypothetical protein [Candidatus Limnocylindrales bacterium]
MAVAPDTGAARHSRLAGALASRAGIGHRIADESGFAASLSAAGESSLAVASASCALGGFHSRFRRRIADGHRLAVAPNAGAAHQSRIAVEFASRAGIRHRVTSGLSLAVALTPRTLGRFSFRIGRRIIDGPGWAVAFASGVAGGLSFRIAVRSGWAVAFASGVAGGLSFRFAHRCRVGDGLADAHNGGAARRPRLAGEVVPFALGGFRDRPRLAPAPNAGLGPRFARAR